MIARCKNSSAVLTKTSDSFAVSNGQSVALIDREQPQLVETTRIESTQEVVAPISVLTRVYSWNHRSSRRDRVFRKDVNEPIDRLFSLHNRSVFSG